MIFPPQTLRHGKTKRNISITRIVAGRAQSQEVPKHQSRLDELTSVMGQKETCASIMRVSVRGSKADIADRYAD
jgi:hypothetical protein